METAWGSIDRKYPELRGDIHTDVLIIGGGITGILTAYFLHQKGVRYILVEKNRICRGTTGRTTAKITFQHGLIYQKLLKNSGFDTALKYFIANRRAFNEYARLCEDIDCDYEIKDNYVYSRDDRDSLEDEMRFLSDIGYNAEFCEKIPVPVNITGAVKFPHQAQFNPIKFLSKISEKLNIYENTFVREMIGTTAVTSRGKIYADKVIATTHFPFINKHGSYFLKLYQHRSYVIGLENAQNVNGMYVDNDKKGMSFRNYGDLLLLGGGGHRTGKPGGNYGELILFAQKHYPDAPVKFRSSAQDCMSLDGIPYIGRYSKNTPRLFTATGFNKWGMTSSMVSAMILSDMAVEVKNEFEDIFSPSRSIIKPQLFVNAGEAVKGLATFSSKRCPHMGCALKWNSAEHSWDCSCHGSRFSEKGIVLDNPANGNLKK